MKSIKRIILALVMVLSIIGITGCFSDVPEVPSFTVTFNTNGGSAIAPMQVPAEGKLVLPSNPTKDGFNFISWHTDELLTDESVWKDEVVIKDFTLYAKWEEIPVGPVEEVIASSASLPTSFLNHLNNKGEKENKRTEFFVRDHKFQVGDDNAWKCKPQVTFIKINHQTGVALPTTVASWNFTINVYILHAEGYVLLEAENNYVEAIDNVACTIDFSQEACGKEFKVEVITEGLDDPEEIVSYEIVVVDGYNVYNAKEMSYIENRTSGDEAEVWKTFKEANGLDSTYKPAALIFQDNIEVKKEDVPTYFFYQPDEISQADPDYDRAVGSTKDWKNFYERVFSENETFTIVGNYYTFSIETLREVVRDNGKITPEGELVSHTALFRFSGNETGTGEIKDLNIVGNAPRVENKVKAGGQIFIKVQGPAFNATNNIASCFFTVYMPYITFKPFVVDYCKAYDSFSSFIYNKACDKFHLKNSEMIGAGGPIIVQDHQWPTNEDGGKIGKSLIENCNLQSYVAGTEGWFTVVKATSIVPLMKSLDNLFTPFGRALLTWNTDKTVSYFNFVLVNKSGTATTLTSEKIKGEIEVGGYKFNFGESNPYVKAMLESPDLAKAPVFETSAGGYSFGTNTGIYTPTMSQIVNPQDNMYKGEYITVYYNSMMLTFKYVNVGEVYNVQ